LSYKNLYRRKNYKENAIEEMVGKKKIGNVVNTSKYRRLVQNVKKMVSYQMQRIERIQNKKKT